MRIHREILRLAVPNVISNITVPLMGLVATAIAGHLEAESPGTTIGALAIGVSIFNFIYWNCSFVRMGTSGLTAQAFGAGDRAECTRMLGRALLIGAALGVSVLLLKRPLGQVSLHIMKGDELAAAYFYARVWAVPAGVMLFALNGWFTGMQNAVIPMVTAITVNLLHILFSLWFALSLEMGIVGIARASVVSQYAGLALAAVLLAVRYGRTLVRVPFSEILDPEPLRQFFRINRDIMIRTLCLVAVYTFFTAASARMEAHILAVNTILLQLFTLFSYMNDGFAYAAEALTGRFVGARDAEALRRSIRGCVVWGAAMAVAFVAAYAAEWRPLVGLFVDAKAADAAQIVSLAGRYVGWVVAIPIAGTLPFILDGIMVGATQTRVMRNAMIGAAAGYFLIFYALRPLLGNDALWLAFLAYMVLRGALMYLLSDRLDALYRFR